MQTDYGLYIGTSAGEFEHIAAAKTGSRCRLPAKVANAAFFAFDAQGFESGDDASSPFCCVGAQCICQRGGFRWSGRYLPPPYMSATNAMYLLPAISAARLVRDRRHRASSARSAVMAGAR